MSPTNVPDVLRSHGGDTPNSMAVERATEPSLRSYSPTSSIRAASEADYTDSPPPAGLGFSPSHSLGFFVPSPSTPLNESVATLVPLGSPQGTLVGSPEKEKEKESGPQNETALEDFVVVSGRSSAAPSEGVAERVRESSTVAAAAAGPGSGKTFLSRGRIDAKAQDDFIAFMMGKK
jgi:hypothetical protein